MKHAAQPESRLNLNQNENGRMHSQSQFEIASLLPNERKLRTSVEIVDKLAFKQREKEERLAALDRLAAEGQSLKLGYSFRVQMAALPNPTQSLLRFSRKECVSRSTP